MSQETKKDKKKKNAIDVSLININNNEKKEVNEMTKTIVQKSTSFLELWVLITM